MRSLRNLTAASLGGLVLWAVVSGADETKSPAMDVLTETPEPPAGKVTRTEAEWRAMLTPEQFRILRQAGTERPNGQVYKEFKAQGEGAYHCAGCNALLFSSNEKFDSGCGWPSFYDPANAENVKTKPDLSHGMVRIEVICAVCEGHLGHVFEGEGFDTPTDKRYCINGVGLRFVPAEAATKQEEEKPESPEEAEPETP